MGTSKSAKAGWEFPLQVAPAAWKVRVFIAMGGMGDVVGLANIDRSGIRNAVRGMIA
jgi:hypothetical protein